jgi:predicted enzyme related to lactoylglutathione lyase
VYKEALVADGIPFTSFQVEDAQAEYERLSAAGVKFVQEPTDLGPVVTAVFDDTCGNLIQIAAEKG